MTRTLVAEPRPRAAIPDTGWREPIPDHWPLIALFVGYPLWWAMGLANLAWPLLTIPLMGQLLKRRGLRVWRGFGLWVLFLGVVVMSSSQLDRTPAYIAYAFRLSLWLGALTVLLYVLNAPRRVLPERVVTNLLLWLWAATVVGGYLGLFLGARRLWTPAQPLVEWISPDVAQIDFIRDTIAPRFAQVQDFLGLPLARPAAPFTYTNEWGSNMALLCPIVVGAWPLLNPVRRRVVGILAAAAVVPIIVSVNRGLWITLIGVFLYVPFRLAMRHDRRAARRLFAAALVVFAIVALTPLIGLISDRLDNDHSNRARSTIYTEVIDKMHESPLIGFGGPQANENPYLPPLGTHGTFWLVLFSHGIPGEIFFVTALGILVVRTSRPKDNRRLWFHGAVVGALLMIPFYELLPVPIFTMAMAAGLALRDGDLEPGELAR